MLNLLLTDRRAFTKKLIAMPSSPAKKKLVKALVPIIKLNDREVIDSLTYSWFTHNHLCSPIQGEVLFPKYLTPHLSSHKKFFATVSDLLKIIVNKQNGCGDK